MRHTVYIIATYKSTDGHRMTRMSHERLLHCDYELLAAQPGGHGGAGGYVYVYIYIYIYIYI